MLRARLMERLQEGDTDACRALLDDIGPLLTRFLRRRIAEPQEIEDVYQEVLMAVFEARHTYESSRPLEPWLFAIAHNIAADHVRRRWSRTRWEGTCSGAARERGSSHRYQRVGTRQNRSQASTRSTRSLFNAQARSFVDRSGGQPRRHLSSCTEVESTSSVQRSQETNWRLDARTPGRSPPRSPSRPRQAACGRAQTHASAVAHRRTDGAVDGIRGCDLRLDQYSHR
jgi:RNA polymerase sigma factor (sigma-70 family)